MIELYLKRSGEKNSGSLFVQTLKELLDYINTPDWKEKVTKKSIDKDGNVYIRPKPGADYLYVQRQEDEAIITGLPLRYYKLSEFKTRYFRRCSTEFFVKNGRYTLRFKHSNTLIETDIPGHFYIHLEISAEIPKAMAKFEEEIKRLHYQEISQAEFYQIAANTGIERVMNEILQYHNQH